MQNGDFLRFSMGRWTDGKHGARPGIYDLQGRKLSQEPLSGVYIKDGKKVVK